MHPLTHGECSNVELVGPLEVLVLVTSVYWREYVPVDVAVDCV